MGVWRQLPHGVERFLPRGATGAPGVRARILDGHASGDECGVSTIHQRYRICHHRRASARSRDVPGCRPISLGPGLARVQEAAWPCGPARLSCLVGIRARGGLAASRGSGQRHRIGEVHSSASRRPAGPARKRLRWKMSAIRIGVKESREEWSCESANFESPSNQDLLARIHSTATEVMIALFPSPGFAAGAGPGESSIVSMRTTRPATSPVFDHSPQGIFASTLSPGA